MKTKSYTMDDQELATVLAALRYYQEQGLADNPDLRPEAIHDIAIGGDEADFIASLDGASIDELCERLNTMPEKIERPEPVKFTGTPESERIPGQLYAPNGKRISASKDWVPGNALIASATRNPDGTFEIEWEGETKMCWDGQHTEEKDDQRIFLDEDAGEWPENNLTLQS